jgi:hypothetical protein
VKPDCGIAAGRVLRRSFALHRRQAEQQVALMNALLGWIVHRDRRGGTTRDLIDEKTSFQGGRCA